VVRWFELDLELWKFAARTIQRQWRRRLEADPHGAEDVTVSWRCPQAIAGCAGFDLVRVTERRPLASSFLICTDRLADLLKVVVYEVGAGAAHAPPPGACADVDVWRSFLEMQQRPPDGMQGSGGWMRP
jgi:hypothetical protein